MIFIDANIYVVLYNCLAGRKLLEFLVSVADQIFITEQIVREVERNKLDVASEFFEEQAQKLKVVGVQAPDHLFGLEPDIVKEIRAELDKRSKVCSEVLDTYNKHVEKTLNRIATSTDDVSRQLVEIFRHARRPTEDALARARWRQEVGNPPGKKGDPLGDQLSWEQFLEERKPQTVWIVTADGDYVTIYGKLTLLNPVLRQELETQGIKDIRCFTKLLDAVNDYSKAAGSKTQITGEEAATIETEWEETAVPALEALAEARTNPAISVKKVMEIKARERVHRALQEANLEARRSRRG